MSAIFLVVLSGTQSGAVAQLGERLLCKQDVVGSIPSGSTTRAIPKGLSRFATILRIARRCRVEMKVSEKKSFEKRFAGSFLGFPACSV